MVSWEPVLTGRSNFFFKRLGAAEVCIEQDFSMTMILSDSAEVGEVLMWNQTFEIHPWDICLVVNGWNINFIFPEILVLIIIPIDELHHFSEGWPWPTNQWNSWPVGLDRGPKVPLMTWQFSWREEVSIRQHTIDDEIECFNSPAKEAQKSKFVGETRPTYLAMSNFVRSPLVISSLTLFNPILAEANFKHALSYDYLQEVRSGLGALDVRGAKASSTADEDLIKRLILQFGGKA